MRHTNVRNIRNFSALGSVLALLVMVFGTLGIAIGYVFNIITLFHSSFSTITGELVLRIIGVFAFPIGAILGYM